MAELRFYDGIFNAWPVQLLVETPMLPTASAGLKDQRCCRPVDNVHPLESSRDLRTSQCGALVKNLFMCLAPAVCVYIVVV